MEANDQPAPDVAAPTTPPKTDFAHILTPLVAAAETETRLAEMPTSILRDVSLPSPGPRLLRRTPWLDLPPEYPGFKVRLWVNAPRALVQDIFSPATNEEQTVEALLQVVLEHNGWCDEEGQPYPPATERAFWDGSHSIPTELSAVVMKLIQTAPYLLPNSLAASPVQNGRR